MRLKWHPGIFLGTVLLLSIALSPLAEAGIVYSSFQFNDPIFAFSSNTDVKVSGTVPGEGGTYTLSAEFCQTGSCTGDLSSSDTLRMTNFNISCSGSFCAPIDISFQANGSTDDGSTPFLVYLEDATFSGTAPTGFVQLCIADGSHVCSATGSGPQSSTFTFGSSLSGTTTFNYSPNGPFTIVGDFHLDGLANGSSVSIPNSLDILDLPEPADFLLVSTGLAGLLLLLRRRRKNAAG